MQAISSIATNSEEMTVPKGSGSGKLQQHCKFQSQTPKHRVPADPKPFQNPDNILDPTVYYSFLQHIIVYHIFLVSCTLSPEPQP